MTTAELMEETLRKRPLVGHDAEAMLLERTQNTLSSDVAGLIGPQNLAEIVMANAAFRPIVTSARNVTLRSGKLTYPQVTSRPDAAKQNAEKTTAGTGTKLAVTQATLNADTYNAGGDLSWQAATYATPDLITTWMTFATQSYLKATENAAAAALVAGTTATGTVAGNTLAQWLTAITTAAATVQSNDYQADVLYADPVTAAKLGALVYAITPDATAIARLQPISTNGLTAVGPIAIVGYSQALYCAENPNAPVQLQIAEPALGGLEIGVIGGFASVVADPNGFVKLTPP